MDSHSGNLLSNFSCTGTFCGFEKHITPGICVLVFMMGALGTVSCKLTTPHEDPFRKSCPLKKMNTNFLNYIF